MKRFLAALATLLLLSGTVMPAALTYAASTNLIANPSVETASGSAPANWTPNSWGTNTSTLTYMTGGHTGNKSLYISMAAHTSGDAKWMPDPVAITAGQSYTYSEFYESSVATELDAAYTDASGNVTYAYLGGVNVSSSWQQATAVFTAPTTAVKVAVLNIIAAPGTLQTDDFSLTQTVVVPPPSNPNGNLIANPSFETANGSTPANWQTGSWGTNNAQFSYSNNAHTGTKSATVAITSYTSGDAKWYANPVTVTAGSTYTYSDYYESAVSTSVVAAYTTSAGVISYADLPNAAAGPTGSTWELYSANLTIPAAVTNVTIYHLLASVGSLTIDDVSLALATVTPPPANGNLIANPLVQTVNPTNSKLPTNWSTAGWGTNTTTFTYGGAGYGGSKSLNVTTTKYTSGDAKWVPDAISTSQDQMYKFSEYYESNVQTEVDAVFNMNDGSTIYQIISQPAAASTWTNLTSEFAVPLGAQSLTIYHLLDKVGSLTTSDFSLTSYKPVGFNAPLVSLTFDDGYASTMTDTLPLLQQYGLTSTQFIITDLLGQSGYLTNANVTTLAADGEEIGSHTVTHDDLTLSTTNVSNELSQSKSTLNGLIKNVPGATVTDLAYPYGLYNPAVIAATKSAGYASARGVEDGFNSKDNLNLYDLKVQNIYDTTTTAQVADWVAQAKATNTWLILVYHSVDNNPNPATDAGIYNITTSQFSAQLAAIKAAGVTVNTLQQALKVLTPQL